MDKQQAGLGGDSVGRPVFPPVARLTGEDYDVASELSADATRADNAAAPWPCEKRSIPAGNPSQGCRPSSQMENDGAGKAGSAKHPTAIPRKSGATSASQYTEVP